MFLPKLAVWGMRGQKPGSVASLMLQQVIWGQGGFSVSPSILPNASWSQGGCRTFGFPCASKMNEEGGTEEERMTPLYQESQTVAEIPSRAPLGGIIWNRVTGC